MRNLAELQAAMTQAIIAGSFVDVEREFTAGNADPACRFAIYRNNMFLSLTAHLRAVYPVTARLGDERFFAYAAHQFILREPPDSSRLVVYGAAFPQFLSRFPACRHAPILAEMATLEWAIHSSLTSAQHPFLETKDMAAISAGQALELQPSLRFVLSRWPVLGLWAHQAKRQQVLPRKTSRIAVIRHDDDIRFFELGAARLAFWRYLARHRSLEEAATRALARDAQFSLADELVFLFRNRLVTGFDTVQPDQGLIP
jgi:hypothetical protein